jgi:RNA polymerase sigma-70 factor (ECF subfamily)
MADTSGDEAALIHRAQKGDADAFSELYNRHYAAIYRYAFFRVADASAAEDIASDVFVRLVEHIGRYRYRGRPLLAWLYTIARNLVIDHQRATGRKRTVPLEERDVAWIEDDGSGQERILTRQMLLACIERLTEDQRCVILLKFVEGLDNGETARVMGKPVGAVKSLQHRALAAMRRCLDEEPEPR